MIKKNFVASRIKDHKSNIVTKMWNIQQKLDDVIAMGRGDTDLDTPRHIIDAGINALNNGATHYTVFYGEDMNDVEIITDKIRNTKAFQEFVKNNGGSETLVSFGVEDLLRY